MKAEKHRLPLSGDITIEVTLGSTVHVLAVYEALELAAGILRAVEGEPEGGVKWN